jgi:hypothetical protein
MRSRRVRAATVIAHITAVGGWVGIDIALIALSLTRTPIPTVLSELAIVSAVLTITTGITLAIRRPWGGLRRHRWIETKTRITAIVVAAGLASIAGMLDPMSVLAARIGALVGLVAAVAVSVTKPGGLTPYGRLTTRPRHRHRLHSRAS